MSHLVEQMAYVGRTPWHGLGNRLVRQQPIEVWIQQAGLDWKIRESPVHFIAGVPNRPGELLRYSDQKVLYRSDNRAPLSVVSQRYRVVQPHEILEFYRDLTEVSGFELETAGVLKGGRKIWALARTGQSGVLKGKDRTDAYMLLAKACDGTMATTAQFTGVRVVCNNTLAVALNGETQSVKVSHRSAFDADAVKHRLGLSISAWDDFMYRLKALSERKVKKVQVQTFLHQVFQERHDSPHTKAIETAMAAVQALYDGAGRGANLASAHGTAYGLLNAVTEFVDHERRARSTGHRLDSAWFGQGAAIKRRALDQAMRLAA